MTSPQPQRLADGGPGYAVHYPPGAYPVPMVIRCSVRACPSALAMPHDAAEDEQHARLTGADWAYSRSGWACPADHTGRWTSPPPPALTPWGWLALMAGLYAVLLAGLLALMAAVGAPIYAFVAAALLLTSAWWALVGFCWATHPAPQRPARRDTVPVAISPGRQITDPDEAEALGLTADARRMRRGSRAGE
jgi:hypothetical protein